MRIEEKPWDSKVLGVRCGEVHCLEYHKPFHFEGWDFLHSRPSVSEEGCIATLGKLGFVKVSDFLLLRRDLRAHPPDPLLAEFAYREAEEKDAEWIGNLAARIFVYDRLHADNRIPRKVADAYKRAWGESLCKGYAEHVYLAGDSKLRPIGFVSIRGSTVGLNGVHPKFRRRGIGFGLVELACKHLADLGNHYAFTSTQRSNMLALNMYFRKCHFRIQEMACDFHWIREGLEWK